MQVADKLETVPLSNKKLRRKLDGQVARARVEVRRRSARFRSTSRSGSSSARKSSAWSRSCPTWRQDLRKLEGRSSQTAQAKARELKREIRKREADRRRGLCRHCGTPCP